MSVSLGVIVVLMAWSAVLVGIGVVSIRAGVNGREKDMEPVVLGGIVLLCGLASAGFYVHALVMG